MKFYEVASYKEMSRKAANIISAEVITNPNAVLGLATGSSPIGTYKQLIEWYNKGDIDFSGVTAVNLDEYYGLSEDNEQSYRYFMNKNFFDHININKARTYVPNGLAKDPVLEGKLYDERIKALGGIDIQLLGIGLDGHIGFNEPNDVFMRDTHLVDLNESTIKANARFFESEDKVPRQAITMGMMSIMRAKKILLIAAGEKKEAVVREAFNGVITPKLPASILQLHPNVTVIFTKESN
ncbi:MAG: glucosamine-6-phosphate deaminase [Oscillospiraceae bacterium]|nr:glucosamine-6-phosphate deaminase [Oscillospiraceae bacterium]